MANKVDKPRRMLSYYAESDAVDKLSPRAENLFTRLLPLLDDNGNQKASPAWLKLNCFPKPSCHNMTNQYTKRLRDELVTVGIAVLYGEDGCECAEGDYIHYVQFDEHQSLKRERRAVVPPFRGKRNGCTPKHQAGSDTPLADASPTPSSTLNVGQEGDDTPKNIGQSEGDISEDSRNQELNSPRRSKEEDKVQGNQACSIPVQHKSEKPAPCLDPREWQTDAFGIPAERIRNCVRYKLDVQKNPWYLANLTPASLTKSGFVVKLHNETPPDWTPPVRDPHAGKRGVYQMVPGSNCSECHGKGKIFDNGLSYQCSCNTRTWVPEDDLYAV